MKHLPFYEKGFFIPALFLSASIHGLLLGASGWIAQKPDASVIQAPSSLEVTVIARPVVSVVEDEIVSEEIIEGFAPDEVIFSGQVRGSVPEKRIEPLAESEESRGAVTKAKPLSHANPAPPYPRIARQRGWEGTVRLEVMVDKDGIPGRVKVEETSGYEVLDKAALRAVEQWRFLPARSGPMRFASRVTIPIKFTLMQE